MPLPRLQLFEFNDLDRPEVLRATVVETLSRTLHWGRYMEGLVPAFREFVVAADTTDVLDLCSGAGGPAEVMLDALTRDGGTAPRFVLTDLYPQPTAWTRIQRRYPNHVTFERAPIDATRIINGVGAHRARVIINALHHFPPEIARAVLADAVRARAPIFIAEAFGRDPMGFVRFFPYGIPALLANPVLATRQRALKGLLTWALPVTAAVSAWDGFVSTMRIHSTADMRAWADELNAHDYRWQSGEFPTPFGGTGIWFRGIPDGSP